MDRLVFYVIHAQIWYNDRETLEYFELGDPDNKVHGANMGPTWVLSVPDGPHVGPMNLAVRGGSCRYEEMR